MEEEYGIEVKGNMMVKKVIIYIVMKSIWKWRVRREMKIIIGLIVIDMMLLRENIIKVNEGGWE